LFSSRRTLCPGVVRSQKGGSPPGFGITPSSFAKQKLAGKILGSNTTLQCSGRGKVNLASQTSNTLRKANGQKAATAVTKNCGHL
jgi:hypothetical protein